MALPEIRGTARLLADPRKGLTKTDKRWASVLVKFPTFRKTDNGWDETDGVVAKVSAFDDLATALAGHTKGDEIGVHGTVKASVWNDKPQLDVNASQIWAPERRAKTKAPADT
jgi:single-stranded DNA-binding protein